MKNKKPKKKKKTKARDPILEMMDIAAFKVGLIPIETLGASDLGSFPQKTARKKVK